MIQISSGCIREEALFEHLKKLGISAENERHPQFGDVRELLQNLVKRRVFLRERSVYDDPAAGFSFELAEGAETMIGYENIDKFVNEIMRTTVTTNESSLCNGTVNETRPRSLKTAAAHLPDSTPRPPRERWSRARWTWPLASPRKTSSS